MTVLLHFCAYFSQSIKGLTYEFPQLATFFNAALFRINYMEISFFIFSLHQRAPFQKAREGNCSGLSVELLAFCPLSAIYENCF